MAKRREYTPEHKAKLVIEVLREEQTMSEIASREGISLNQLSNWKSEFLSNAGRVLSKSRDESTLNVNINKIAPLDREKWQGYSLPFHYISHNYYDVEIKRSGDNFNVSFVKKPFDTPFVHEPNDTDRLYQPWWDDVKAWGIAENGRLIAVIETAAEEWSNRLRVTELWIDEAYRRQGIGTALMDIAVKRAQEEKRRAVMLETQSRNEDAIAFYLAYGFTLIGFNACEYQNNDLDRKEVRMEMGILL